VTGRRDRACPCIASCCFDTVHLFPHSVCPHSLFLSRAHMHIRYSQRSTDTSPFNDEGLGNSNIAGGASTPTQSYGEGKFGSGARLHDLHETSSSDDEPAPLNDPRSIFQDDSSDELNSLDSTPKKPHTSGSAAAPFAQQEGVPGWMPGGIPLGYEETNEDDVDADSCELDTSEENDEGSESELSPATHARARLHASAHSALHGERNLTQDRSDVREEERGFPETSFNSRGYGESSIRDDQVFFSISP